MSLAPGTSLGRYTIERSIGSGGAGEVYAAKDEQLDRRVALKLLRTSAALPKSSRSPDSDPKSRIVREARSAAALTHPNCISIFDVGELEVQGLAVPYLAMELVDGETLRMYIGDDQHSMDERIGWLADLARALNAAHQEGMVHRDVKPENVMIRRDGVLKVLDFGVAKRARLLPPPPGQSFALSKQTPSVGSNGIPPASVSSDMIALGTVVYMAPEQVRGERLDGRTDQFAWGVVAFELLSGLPPWPYSGDPVHYVLETMETDPPSLRALEPDVPEHVEAAILRALSKRPEDRFPTMSDLLSALGMGMVRPRERSIPPADSSSGRSRLHVETPSLKTHELAALAANSSASHPAQSASEMPSLPPTPPTARMSKVTWIAIVVAAIAVLVAIRLAMH